MARALPQFDEILRFTGEGLENPLSWSGEFLA
jgi:hypothetical protein